MKHFINLKDIKTKDLRNIILDAKKENCTLMKKLDAHNLRKCSLDSDLTTVSRMHLSNEDNIRIPATLLDSEMIYHVHVSRT